MEKVVKKKRKQIAFDITPELHTEIKVLAARRNISINLWMNRAILERIQKEKKYEDKEKLPDVL